MAYTIKDPTVYYKSQGEALDMVFDDARSRGYEPILPDRIWAEHVTYGSTVKYNFELQVIKTGNIARKSLTISLYRMESGNYEITHYIF